jgi:hypothetical protein
VAPGYTRFPDYLAKPPHKLDLAFVIDDSPSMGPKRDKLTKQLPRFVDALRDPNDGSLPSLRLAILDGDLGNGDGDAGALQVIDGLACGMTDPAAHWLQTATLTPANFTGDISQVFACLAGGLGQSGSAFQQPLQPLAFSAASSGPASLAQFAREDAYLGIVIISDQDDCSSLPNAGMFAPGPLDQAPTLRCALRGHECGGAAVPEPGAAGFASPWRDCAARTDPVCPILTDVSRPTSCTPLADVHALAEQVKALKGSRGDEMIAVVGIFGWPLSFEDFASAEYKIAPIPNPGYATGSSLPATVYDLWPICYDPEHPPSNPDPATGFAAVAASYGAKPGLRLSAFIDEFGANGLKYSLCGPDWWPAMKAIGPTRSLKLRNHCIDQKLVDTDPSTVALEPDCIVEFLAPKVEIAPPPSCSPSTDGGVALTPPGSDDDWTKTLAPRCDEARSVLPCWDLTLDMTKCPVRGLLLKYYRVPPPYTAAGARLRVQCRTCPELAAGLAPLAGCSY